MKEVIVAILLLALFNTILLLRHSSQQKCNCNRQNCNKENFETDRLSTRYGPYEGISFCSGIGARTINKNKKGDNSDLFVI